MDLYWIGCVLQSKIGGLAVKNCFADVYRFMPLAEIHFVCQPQLELAKLLWAFMLGQNVCVCVCMYAERTRPFMCRRAGERWETQLFRGLGVCACIGKQFCSFLHCMHIWKLTTPHGALSLSCMALSIFISLFQSLPTHDTETGNDSKQTQMQSQSVSLL